MLIQAVLVVASYLLGSILFSVIAGKMVKGVDIRNYGSGNAGATNTLRVIGKGPAIAVFISDVGKGVLGVCLARWFAPDDSWMAVLCGIAVILGHNWPVWYRFRGGKGIASTIGMVMTLALVPAIFAGVIAIITIVLTRYVSLGSLLFTVFFPIFIYWIDFSVEMFWGSLVILVFAWVKHRKNIINLIRGKENKLGSKSNNNYES